MSSSQSFAAYWARLKSWVWMLFTFNWTQLPHQNRWLLAIISLLTIQCGLDVENPIPPSPPKWIQKSLPEEWPERGIDAHESGGIYLEWEDIPDKDIIVYILFRAIWDELNDSIGDYDLISRMEMKTLYNFEYIDQDVQIRTRYYYKLKAEEATGNVSAFSDSVFYTLLPELRFESMLPNGQNYLIGSQRELNWEYGFSVELENFCLTILNESEDLVLRILLQPTNYVGSGESWSIPSDIEMDDGKIYKWRIDTGAQYMEGLETVGSESKWATFLFSNNLGKRKK